MKWQQLRFLPAIALLTLAICSCGPKYSYNIPESRDDGWQIATLEEVGIDERVLSRAMDQIDAGKFGSIHSLLIVKDGKLVLEEYFDGYSFDFWSDEFQGDFMEFGIDTPHNQASVTKVYTSALIGIAIEQGFLKGVDQKVFDYFPEYTLLNDEAKRRITLEHLLTMTSGLDWNQGDLPITDERNDIIQVHIAQDPVTYILDKSMVVEPGVRWYYSEADVNLLGEVIQNASGLRLDDFAQQYLFEPLGFTGAEWKLINPDFVWASGDLKIRPRDMAKMGYLYLKGGMWNGKRILSEGWIQQSTEAYIDVPNSYMAEHWGDRYGYHWWLRTFQTDSGKVNALLRSGWGGQAIYVFPDLDLVVVFTGGNYAADNYMQRINEIVSRQILPSVK